jgi:hypothetical protein
MVVTSWIRLTADRKITYWNGDWENNRRWRPWLIVGHEQQPREPSAASFIRGSSKNGVAIRIEDDGHEVLDWGDVSRGLVRRYMSGLVPEPPKQGAKGRQKWRLCATPSGTWDRTPRQGKFQRQFLSVSEIEIYRQPTLYCRLRVLWQRI